MTGRLNAATAFSEADVRSRFPRFSPDARAANQPLVDLLSQIAEDKNLIPGTDRARLAAGPATVHCADPGTRKLHRLEEYLAAAVEFTANDLATMNAAAAAIELRAPAARAASSTHEHGAHQELPPLGRTGVQVSTLCLARGRDHRSPGL